MSVKFTPLAGAKTESYLCYLLQIDECRILLDCGWDDEFDVDFLEPLQRVAESVDFVLISHADVSHLGALAYARKNFGLKCPVYSTIPVYTMGQMFMYDIHQAKSAVEDFKVFSLDDVDDAFSAFKQLKYSQHLRLTGKGKGITITPYAAGRTLGGTIWKISKDAEDIVYAVDYNHKKERHLNPTLLETFVRPTLLITDAKNVFVSHKPRKERDKQLIDSIMSTLKAGGNVLLPIDTAGRVLELLLVLDEHWNYYQLRQYGLALFNYVASNVVEFAKSQLEWLADEISKRFESTRTNVFELGSAKLCHDRAAVDALPGPKVILASMETLACGPAKEMFLDWAADPRNLVLFTQQPLIGSLAHDVLHANVPAVLDVEVSRREVLEGDELLAYQKQRREEQAALREAAAAAAIEDSDDEDESGSDDDDDDSEDTGSESTSTDNKTQQKTVYDSGDDDDGKDNDDDVDDKAQVSAAHDSAPLVQEQIDVEHKELPPEGVLPAEDAHEHDSTKTKHDDEARGRRRRRRRGNKRKADSPHGTRDTSHRSSSDAGKENRGERAPSGSVLKRSGKTPKKARRTATKTIARVNPLTIASSLFASSHDVRVGQFLDRGATAPVFPIPAVSKDGGTGYGIAIDVAAWVARAAAAGAAGGGASADIAVAGAAPADAAAESLAQLRQREDAVYDEQLERPCKTVRESLTIDVRMRHSFIDFEGRSDGKSIKTILSHVKPRKLILIRGTFESLTSLAEHCTTALKSSTRKVLMPDILETVDVTADTNVYRVRLSDALLMASQFHKVGQYELSYIDAEVTGGGVGSNLELVPLKDERVKGHRAVFVGDARLVELKKLLIDAGFKTELRGGYLLCNEQVLVRKVFDNNTGEPTLKIDGVLCENYFKIRKLLYSQFRIL